ncbi:MAG: hypothetical protein HYZ72_17595 [Deltaproteobacteria bacterium]|nr:hypothetical protein [Deltaproteobacteria bacterium]
MFVVKTLLFALLTAAILASKANAAEYREVTISSKEIVERLARLEEGQKALGQRMDDLNRRMDDLNRRIEWGFGVTFAGIFALIGFVIWDRRTALTPAISRTERLEAVLKEYAEKSPDLAEALRKAKIL